MENPILLFGTGVSSLKDEDGLYNVVRAALESGITAFDTAPSYGTELVLGRALHRAMSDLGLSRDAVWIQTKIDAWQMQAGDIRGHVKSALDKMGEEYFDALLIHWPVPEYFESTWKEFIALKADGLVRSVGACNVRMRQLLMYERLGVVPDIIQIERHPLRTCLDEFAFCKGHGFALQAYSPLCKFPPDIRDSQILKNIAERHGKSVGQVVLRWHIDGGYSPIFTSKNVQRIKEYSHLFDFSLSSDEIVAINSLDMDYKLYLESMACPGF